MAGHTSDRDDIIAGINVTPLVDITLVLLLIFIVTAKIVVAPAVPLDLPATGNSEQVQVIFSVLLPNTGPTLINGRVVADDTALQREARDALSRDPQLRAVIQADGNVAHRRVMAVLDVLKDAGVSRIAFGTALEPSER